MSVGSHARALFAHGHRGRQPPYPAFHRHHMIGVSLARKSDSIRTSALMPWDALGPSGLVEL